MKVKVSELLYPALDWAVGQAMGLTIEIEHRALWEPIPNTPGHRVRVTPSINWLQGGPIIEREEIGLRRNAPCFPGHEWEALPSITARGAGGQWGYGPTPLIAAMRCFVASKLGDEVEVPDALL